MIFFVIIYVALPFNHIFKLDEPCSMVKLEYRMHKTDSTTVIQYRCAQLLTYTLFY